MPLCMMCKFGTDVPLERPLPTAAKEWSGPVPLNLWELERATRRVRIRIGHQLTACPDHLDPRMKDFIGVRCIGPPIDKQGESG